MAFPVAVNPFIGPAHISHYIFFIINLNRFKKFPRFCNNIIEFLFCCPSAGAVRQQNIARTGVYNQLSQSFQSNKVTVFIFPEFFKTEPATLSLVSSLLFAFPNNAGLSFKITVVHI